jgi:hypothetical protein
LGRNWDETLRDCDGPRQSEVSRRDRLTTATQQGSDDANEIGDVPRSWWIKVRRACGIRAFPVAKNKREARHGKNDLDLLSIEELAALRESATDKLMEKVVARRAELEAELEKLSQYDKLARKSQAAPVAKARKSDEQKADVAKEPVAKAA